jgi:SAM domain (Sterile alpha motif)
VPPPPETEVAEWLSGLGLGQYAAAFAENDIAFAMLAKLTDEDLQACGVQSLGHRKILIEAIRNLPAAGSKPASALPPDTRKPVPRAAPALASAISAPTPPPTVIPQAGDAIPQPPQLPRRGVWAKILASKFLVVSIAVHVLFGAGATLYVVQRYQANRKLTFKGGAPTTNPSKRAMEHKVSMAKKKNSMSAPAQAKRITTSGLSKIALPDMPSMPTATTVTANKMGGMGGVGVGMGPAGGMGGGGMGGGGGGTIPFFGFRGGKGIGLTGNFYDLKQTTGKKPSEINAGNYTAFVREFVKENFRESLLHRFFKAPNALSAVQFMIPHMEADEAPKAYDVQGKVKPAQWLALYKGKVAPPKDGTFHFVGSADDVLLVRFGGKLVLDASWEDSSGLKPEGVYKDHYGNFPRGGFIKGEAIRAQADQWYDLEVVIGERPGGFFFACLLMEEKGAQYPRDGHGDPVLPLFRLADAKLPKPKKDQKYPPFAEGGPVWRAQGGGGGSVFDALRPKSAGAPATP